MYFHYEIANILLKKKLSLSELSDFETPPKKIGPLVAGIRSTNVTAYSELYCTHISISFNNKIEPLDNRLVLNTPSTIMYNYFEDGYSIHYK